MNPPTTCPFCEAPVDDQLPKFFTCGEYVETPSEHGHDECLARQPLWHEVQRLRSLVEEAYKEGVETAFNEPEIVDWNYSFAKQTLDQP